MKIEIRHSYQASREQVWEYLQDVGVLERTLPGCKKLTPVGDGRYDAELGLDVGPIKGSFAGEVTLLDLNVPESYRLRLRGSGKPGEVDADAVIRLVETGTGTEVICESEAQVTGMLASVGQRVMGSVARMLLGRFFKGVEAEMQKATLRS